MILPQDIYQEVNGRAKYYIRKVESGKIIYTLNDNQEQFTVSIGAFEKLLSGREAHGIVLIKRKN